MALTLGFPVDTQAGGQAAAPVGQSDPMIWPSDGWWSGFGDAQLDALIAEGLKGATDLRVADARYRAAIAATGGAKAELLPQIGIDAEAGVAKQSYNYLFPAAFAPKGWKQTGLAYAGLSWQLDFWGKTRASIAAARATQQAAGAEAAAARLTVASGIAAAYANLAELYAEHDAAADAVKVRAQTLDLTSQRRDQGLENDGAVARARSGLATAQGEVAALDEQIALSGHAIAALLGAQPDRAATIGRPTITAAALVPATERLPAELIGRRPDVIAARDRASAAARVRVAKAAFYPNINLSAIFGFQALGLSNLFKSGSDYGSAGPAITLPIFDGGRLRANKRGAEADYAEAVAQYDGTLVNALHEVADAVTSQRELARRLTSAQDAETAARQAWQVANNRYRGGLATYLDVLVAEDALIAARRTHAALATRSFALDVALIRALGGGYRA